MSVLLTDEALNAAWKFVCPDPDHGDGDQTIRAFVRYHATEGREALIREIAETLGSWAIFASDAEKIVTALFGEA